MRDACGLAATSGLAPIACRILPRTNGRVTGLEQHMDGESAALRSSRIGITVARLSQSKPIFRIVHARDAASASIRGSTITQLNHALCSTVLWPKVRSPQGLQGAGAPSFAALRGWPRTPSPPISQPGRPASEFDGRQRQPSQEAVPQLPPPEASLRPLLSAL
jgi:hypothetical protein